MTFLIEPADKKFQSHHWMPPPAPPPRTPLPFITKQRAAVRLGYL